MAVHNIGLIPASGLYGVLNTFTHDLAKALRQLPQVNAKVFSLDTNAQQFFADLTTFAPDVLIFFNSLFSQGDGGLICDYLKIPTLFYIVDAPFHFDDPDSPYAVVACIDRGHLRNLVSKGFERSFFLPHAVDKAQEYLPEGKRKYGCVMLSSGINYKDVYNKLLGALPPQIVKRVEETFEKFDADPLLTLEEALGPEDTYPVPRALLLKEMDLYLKGKKRVEFLQEMEGIPIDLFGGGDSWEKILAGSCPHVKIHGALDYDAALEVMSEAAVVLNHCSSIRDGAHERLFAAISRGAAAATVYNPYLGEHFQSGEGLILSGSNAGLKDEIERFLKDAALREEAVLKGQKKLSEGHLWSHRAELVYQKLNLFFG